MMAQIVPQEDTMEVLCRVLFINRSLFVERGLHYPPMWTSAGFVMPLSFLEVNFEPKCLHY